MSEVKVGVEVEEEEEGEEHNRSIMTAMYASSRSGGGDILEM